MSYNECGPFNLAVFRIFGYVFSLVSFKKIKLSNSMEYELFTAIIRRSEMNILKKLGGLS